ncbi:hypothetical protein AAG570_008280 [Ranatra chinensis]|uniref:Uncharacterized protein n=1 Tax=Ranatra chinensis TaxID=642074 RepID=A0ABD0Y811_9HEMI
MMFMTVCATYYLWAASPVPGQSTIGDQRRNCEGLLVFLGTVGLLGALVVDRRREFQNARVAALFKQFQGPTIGRISTPPEIAAGKEGPEAVARAVLAHNSSIHVTLHELRRTWKQPEQFPPLDVALRKARKTNQGDIETGRARVVHVNEMRVRGNGPLVNVEH